MPSPRQGRLGRWCGRVVRKLVVFLSADDSATAAKLDNELKNILGGNKYKKSYALETLGPVAFSPANNTLDSLVNSFPTNRCKTGQR